MKDRFFDVPRAGVMTTQGRVDLPMFSDALRTKLHPGVPVAEHETPPLPYAVEGEERAKPLP